MGLSAMENAPDFDQALRFANISGQSQYLHPNAWIGENNLNGIGLVDYGFDGMGDGPTQQQVDPNSPAGLVNTVLGTGLQVWGQIEAQKAAKKAAKAAASKGGGSNAMSKSQGTGATTSGDTGSGSSMTTWLIVGGVAVVGVVVLMMVLKKKKKNDVGGE